MRKINNDINDDEIRVITSDSDDSSDVSREYSAHVGRRSWARVIVIMLACVLLVSGIVFVGMRLAHSGDVPEAVDPEMADSQVALQPVAQGDSDVRAMRPYVDISDTVVGDVSLSILTPVNASPTLHVGTDVLGDSSVVLAVQAADIRKDNGGIVGTFVVDGEIVSKGQAKSGFCAIIGEEVTIGVADATPFFERAVEGNGCFFRQYPLVVANQVVENKPRGVALRKAIADFHGQQVVVLSKTKVSFHTFSQSLVDLGVSNAIYLVGSSANGFAIDRSGNKKTFGQTPSDALSGVNYIVWR